MCAYRMPRDLDIAHSRSRCGRCGFTIAWYDNIPLVSCALLMAKCRKCASPFSWSHLVVEFLVGCMAVAFFSAYGLTFFSFYYFFVACSLLLLSLIDLEFKIIPDELSIGGLVIGLTVALLFHVAHYPWTVDFFQSVLGASLGGGAFWFVGWAYEKITGKEGMGFGDVKLLAMMGAHVGPQGVLVIIFISSLIGSVSGLVLMAGQKIKSRTPIPFGPFLCIAFAMVAFGKNYIMKLCKICIPFLV